MMPRERIVNQILGREVDRIPALGGWFHGPRNLARLAAMGLDEYLADPFGNLIKANRALGVDGMLISLIVPSTADEVRSGGAVMERDHTEHTPEDLERRGGEVPGTESEVLADFGAGAVETAYRKTLTDFAAAYGDIVLIPTFWESVTSFMLYQQYGYGAYLEACALYPEQVERIYWQSSVCCRARNEILVRLYDELGVIPMLFAGHDICINTGPMVSPAFLRERYWPHVRHAIEPLVEAGIRVVHHCDGNVMPVIDDMIAAGFSGFQGFQYELGVDGFEIARRKSAKGERLLFMAGLNVTRTLPFGTTDDVRDEIEYVLDFTDGGKGLLFFTSSSIGPEVPLENVTFAYGHIRDYDPTARRPHAGKWRPWPGRARDG